MAHFVFEEYAKELFGKPKRCGTGMQKHQGRDESIGYYDQHGKGDAFKPKRHINIAAHPANANSFY